jgi:hypothetical protein
MAARRTLARTACRSSAVHAAGARTSARGFGSLLDGLDDGDGGCGDAAADAKGPIDALPPRE